MWNVPRHGTRYTCTQADELTKRWRCQDGYKVCMPMRLERGIARLIRITTNSRAQQDAALLTNPVICNQHRPCALLLNSLPFSPSERASSCLRRRAATKPHSGASPFLPQLLHVLLHVPASSPFFFFPLPGPHPDSTRLDSARPSQSSFSRSSSGHRVTGRRETGVILHLLQSLIH